MNRKCNESVKHAFIIGLPKTATTSIAEWLDKKSDVTVSSKKEPHFFLTDENLISHRVCTTIEEYEGTFSHVENIRVDCSTLYCFDNAAMKKIKAEYPNSRVVLILRNHTDFLRSHHRQQFSTFDENIEDFRKAWDESGQQRVNSRARSYLLLDYKKLANQSKIVREVRNIFSVNNILILFYEDLLNDEASFLQRLEEFLGTKDTGGLLPKTNTFKVGAKYTRWIRRLQFPLVLVNLKRALLKGTKLGIKEKSIMIIEWLFSYLYSKSEYKDDATQDLIRLHYENDIADLRQNFKFLPKAYYE